MDNYDFSGWATRANLKCADGRVILKDAFKHNDGAVVPLVWNHQHNDPFNVLGQARLEHREDGVYAYGTFNNTESGQAAKELVQHGDIVSLSIHANQLKQDQNRVTHGMIREVSLVLAGANPGAHIESVISHGEGSDEEATIYSGQDILLFHAEDEYDDEEETEVVDEEVEETEFDEDEEISHADTEDKPSEKGGETIKDIWNTLSEKQKNAVAYMLDEALKKENSKGEDENMSHNLFENEKQENVLTHADQTEIIKLARSTSVGSLQDAIAIYASENASLKHGIDEIETLFPEYKDVKPGAPELLERDPGWVGVVMQKVHKSPISRIRTRQADARGLDLRAYGYEKGKEKKLGANIKLLSRTTDPQTIYRKDALHRDDIIDITDFDVVEYQYGIMKQNLNEEIATAIMIGDGREDGEPDKIDETHIRSILNDDELYVIHGDVDVEAMRTELTGTENSANFGENYVYAEAIIQKALYLREKYKGSGTPDFYCTPHLLNVMLLARDLNGRRIYESKNDLAAALNVNNIYTAEQFEGKIRTDKENKQHKLLGIFVNLADYQVGSTKGGEITKFNQFDIDFNQEKYLIETRISGALTKVFSAIVLEEPVKA